MTELIETDHFVVVVAGGLTDAARASLRDVVTGEDAAAALAAVSSEGDVSAVGDAAIVQRLGSLVRAQLRGSALTLSVERRDGTLAIFGAPASGGFSTITEPDVLSVSIVDAASGDVLWPTRAAASATSLLFSNGRTIPVEGTMLIGRSPRVERATSADLPALVPLDTDNPAISRTHLKISVDGSRTVLEDLSSTNGTAIAPLGGAPRSLAPGELAELVDGMIVTIAERVAFRVVLS